MRHRWMLAAVMLLGCSQVNAFAAPQDSGNSQPPAASGQTKASSGKTGAKKADTSLPKTDAEWRKRLTPEQYAVLRQKATEREYSGNFWNHKEKGYYVCAGCNEPLFASTTKFTSGCGWPSFYDVMSNDKVEVHDDFSFGMHRLEVTCAKCGGHLGHVFEDAPQTPTGQRYCINSLSLKFVKAKSAPKKAGEKTSGK